MTLSFDQHGVAHLLSTGILLCALLGIAQPAPAGEIRVRVDNRIIGHVDHRLFGQFMERASWGEPGPEAAVVPGTRRLQPSVLERLREMEIPVIRFPGGTDVDYIDWRDLVDNVPGREGGRPVTTGCRGHTITNAFGYDEFLRLWEALGGQPLIVVNFRDGLLRLKPLEEAARHAAGLVAYCNAPVGAALPEGMPDWPAVRKQNGRAEPYGVPYFQIGNEIGVFWDDIRALGTDEEEAADWYVTCLEAYVDAMRAVDPTIQIIADADVEHVLPRLRERLGDRVQYITRHLYLPWALQDCTKDGEPYSIEQVTPEEMWLAWVGVPGIDPETGFSVDRASIYKRAPQVGYRVAVTEWNWNGWPAGVRLQLDSSFAKGVGAAGFIHAFMRQGDAISLGCQSMLVGVSWGINAIRADRTGKEPAHFLPSGQVTMFYSRHHGPDLLSVAPEGIPRYAQPYSMGTLRAKANTVAYIDVLATASSDTVYVHAINRSFGDDFDVHLDLSGFEAIGAEAAHHTLVGRLNDRPKAGEQRQIGSFESRGLQMDGTSAGITLPKRSVSIIEVPCRRGGVPVESGG